MNIPEIKNHQQNRHPLLFIDKILKCEPGQFVESKKCFSYNEWFFPAHFEDEPSVPGFVLVESLVQTFIMTFLSIEEHKGKKTNFISINNARFRKLIVPGDVMIIKAELNTFKRGIAKGSASGYINDELAVSAEFIVALPDVLSSIKPK